MPTNVVTFHCWFGDQWVTLLSTAKLTRSWWQWRSNKAFHGDENLDNGNSSNNNDSNNNDDPGVTFLRALYCIFSNANLINQFLLLVSSSVCNNNNNKSVSFAHIFISVLYQPRGAFLLISIASLRSVVSAESLTSFTSLLSPLLWQNIFLPFLCFLFASLCCSANPSFLTLRKGHRLEILSFFSRSSSFLSSFFHWFKEQWATYCPKRNWREADREGSDAFDGDENLDSGSSNNNNDDPKMRMPTRTSLICNSVERSSKTWHSFSLSNS